MPFANPSVHSHRYAWKETFDNWPVDSTHDAEFWHGVLAHSSTSMSQLPLQSSLVKLSATVHYVVYSVIKSGYPHMPFANPAAHAH